MLTIKGLTKSYGSLLALDQVDLKVGFGETVVIMGPSGCGKSTLIRCINRLTQPDQGSIVVANESILDLNNKELQNFRRNVGFVFQQFNLIARLTVLENVMFHLVLAGMTQDEAEMKGNLALEKVGLKSVGKRKSYELSGGQQQRVGIARALVNSPKIMLWDEPTASLDPILVSEVLEVMEELVRTTATTMLIVTHEVSFAQKVAERIVFMDEGQIVEEGSPANVFSNPSSEIGRLYLKLLLN